jgi:hypothetical protein
MRVYLRSEIDRLSFRPKSDGFTSPVLQGQPEADAAAPIASTAVRRRAAVRRPLRAVQNQILSQ